MNNKPIPFPRRTPKPKQPAPKRTMPSLDVGTPLLMTVKQATKLLNYSDRHIRRLVSDGRLRAVGTGSGIRIIVESITAFINAEEARRAA